MCVGKANRKDNQWGWDWDKYHQKAVRWALSCHRLIVGWMAVISRVVICGVMPGCWLMDQAKERPKYYIVPRLCRRDWGPAELGRHAPRPSIVCLFNNLNKLSSNKSRKIFPILITGSSTEWLRLCVLHLVFLHEMEVDILEGSWQLSFFMFRALVWKQVEASSVLSCGLDPMFGLISTWVDVGLLSTNTKEWSSFSVRLGYFVRIHWNRFRIHWTNVKIHWANRLSSHGIWLRTIS